MKRNNPGNIPKNRTVENIQGKKGRKYPQETLHAKRGVKNRTEIK